jgi:large subunit ribosomal protein L4
MKIKVLNIEGKDTGKEIQLDEAVFGADINEHAVYLAVKQYLANQRQGTHSTLVRSTVSGSTKKIRKQKGSGGARFGSIKNPLFPGGPRTFGPHPRDYSFKLNKKLKDVARRSALSSKIKDEALVIVEDFSIEQPKTKAFISVLKNLGLESKKSLFLMPSKNEGVYLSSRNLKTSRVDLATNLNTYDILNAQVLVLSESSVGQIENLLKN